MQNKYKKNLTDNMYRIFHCRHISRNYAGVCSHTHTHTSLGFTNIQITHNMETTKTSVVRVACNCFQ